LTEHLQAIGSMVLDEEIIPIVGVRLIGGQVIFYARDDGGALPQRVFRGLRIHGEDGSLILNAPDRTVDARRDEPGSLTIMAPMVVEGKMATGFDPDPPG